MVRKVKLREFLDVRRLLPAGAGEDGTLAERTKRLLEGTRNVTLFNMVNALALTIILWEKADHAVELEWLAAVCAVALFRIVHCRRALKHELFDEAKTRRIYTAGAAANGIMWGLAPILFADLYPSIGFHAIIFMIAGMTAGAAATMVYFRPAYFAYLLPAVLPAAYHYLTQSGYEAAIMGGILIAYILAVSITTRTHARAVIDSIKHEQDLHRQKREMQFLAERYMGLYNKTPVMLHSVNTHGRIINVSEYWLEKMGYERYEVISRKILDFMAEDSRSHAVKVVEPAFARDGFCSNVDYQFVTKGGQTIDVLQSMVAEKNEAGETIQCLAVLIDVTDRKAIQQQLAQAQKLDAIGQLTGGIAHDFNNLLAVVLGNLELLEPQLKDNEKAHRRATAAAAAAQSGAELTKRLLAFSRKQPMEAKTVIPDDLIKDMEALFERTLGETVDLKVSLSDDPWYATIDANLFESSVLNLAVNARDAMPDGGELTIGTANVMLDDDYLAGHPDVEAGEYISVSVTDTGTGIPADLVDKILQPFFTTKEVGKGTGLGLSMVYGFVKQSGGHMTVYSEEGHGTTMTLYLPRDTDLEGAQADGEVAAEDFVGGTETILVVDDNPNVREVSVGLLSDLGYAILEATDGPSALEVLNTDIHVDLLLTDIVMPGGMTGPDLAKEALRRRPDLRILYTSGFAQASVLRQSRTEAPGELLAKPYRKPDLARKVRRVLDREQEPVVASEESEKLSVDADA